MDISEFIDKMARYVAYLERMSYPDREGEVYRALAHECEIKLEAARDICKMLGYEEEVWEAAWLRYGGVSDG